MNCLGQLHGHTFEYIGANCSNCGVNQYELSGKTRELKEEPKFTAKSKHGLLFSEICEFFGIKEKKDKNKFNWSIFRHYTGDRLREVFSEIKDLDRAGKLKGNGIGLFVWKLKNK